MKQPDTLNRIFRRWVSENSIYNASLRGDEDIMKLQNTLNEAEEVEFESLDPKDQNKIKAIQKVVGGKRDGVWDGLHGIIVNFSIREAAMSRLSKKQLQGLVKNDIGWIEAKPNRIAVGL